MKKLEEKRKQANLPFQEIAELLRSEIATTRRGKIEQDLKKVEEYTNKVVQNLYLIIDDEEDKAQLEQE